MVIDNLVVVTSLAAQVPELAQLTDISHENIEADDEEAAQVTGSLSTPLEPTVFFSAHTAVVAHSIGLDHGLIFGKHSDNLNEVIDDPIMAHVGDLISHPTLKESLEEFIGIFPNSQTGSRSTDSLMELDSSRENSPLTVNIGSTGMSVAAPSTFAASSNETHEKSESFEESRLFDRSGEIKIIEKAHRALEVGKKLGLIGKVTDEALIRKMENMERRDLAKARKNMKTKSGFGASKVHQ